jgi:hypothetical protein
MRLQVSKATINDICEPLRNTNDEIDSVCKWMEEYHDNNSVNEVQIKEDVRLDTAQKVAILGARHVFNITCKTLTIDISQQPDYQKILTILREYVLLIEGSLIPIHVNLDKMLLKDRSFVLGKTRTAEPGINIVTNSKASYNDLSEFIATTFNGTHCLYNNQKDEGLTEDRFELLKLIGVDIQKTHVNFDNWNTVIVENIMTVLNYDFLEKVDPERKKPVLELIEAFLKAQDFTSLTLSGLEQILSVLTHKTPNYILSANKIELHPVKVKTKTRLNKKQIDAICQGIKYPNVHPLISGPIIQNVRKNLTVQLENLEVENKFVPRLGHIVEERFQSARVRRGHRVGAIAAMSVGEDAAQANLRSFHHAGVSDATGFDRVKEVTDNPNLDKIHNGFTIIGLKGNPDEVQVQLYANLIEETRISDVCNDVIVGRSDHNVPEMSNLFGETPVFIAEPNGWQQRYINLRRKLGRGKNPGTSRRPSFDRPPWLIRLRCNKAKMYQKRITPVIIAEFIEDAINDVIAIASDFTTGMIDVYIHTTNAENKQLKISDDYIKLTMQVVNQIKDQVIQGIQGFTKALTEKFEFVKFITSVESNGSEHFIRFDLRDTKLNGVSQDDLLSFLSNKVGEEAVIESNNDLSFTISGYEGNLREKILAPEVVRLVDLVTSQNVDANDSLVVHLNREKILKEEDVSVFEMTQFFQKQNKIKTFAPVDIVFNRKDFTVVISRAVDFSPEFLIEEFDRFGVSEEKPIIGVDTITYTNINKDANYQGFQIAVKGYGTNISMKLNKREKQIILTLQPMHVSGAWEVLCGNNCNNFSTFSARKRQRLGVRYRILAKGFGIEKLAQVDFVNIYATHSSIPREHYKFFDIEAARDYIHSELVLNVGGDIGDRHLGLISDLMCYVGSTIKLKLSGKRATNSGPLATAYVQESLKLLMDASAGWQVDNLTSAVGMTMIADFNRGEYANKEENKNDNKVRSALDMLARQTVTTRTRVRRKQPEEESKNPVISDVKSKNPFDEY